MQLQMKLDLKQLVMESDGGDELLSEPDCSKPKHQRGQTGDTCSNCLHCFHARLQDAIPNVTCGEDGGMSLAAEFEGGGRDVHCNGCSREGALTASVQQQLRPVGSCRGGMTHASGAA